MKADTSYKKQNGSLEYNDRQSSVTWTPAKTGDYVKLEIKTITNLQQTPALSEKVALKVVAEAGSYTFIFTSGERARTDQESITAILRNAIAGVRAGSTPIGSSNGAGATASGDGPSPAMAIAQAVRSDADASNSWSDDKRLISNGALQTSLFKQDPDLERRFHQGLRDKPDTITPAQFGAQFWSSRLQLLRAHAIEKSQQQGSYNVLAQLKETNVDGARKLNLTKDHIQALFNQHPIIKLIYNEVVPNRLSEAEFWARFFVSKLLRKLKGERVHKDHASDAILDKYLESDLVTLRNKQIAESHIPHYIDLEGNEQNQKWKGNRPDMTMIPEFREKAPLHNILNSMSERMLANVTPSDGPQHGPIGAREGTQDDFRLQDLEAETSDDRVRLNISNRQGLFGGQAPTTNGDAGHKSSTQNPKDVLRSLREAVSSESALDMGTLEEDDQDSAGDQAVSQVVSLIGHQRSLMTTESHATSLSEDTLQSLHLTLNTTTEFLNYFWTVLQAVATGSSSSTRNDLAALNNTLSKSKDRITAVADAAEKQRQGQISELKRQAKEYYEKTGKKRKLDESQVTIGGEEEALSLLQPTIDALDFAQIRYASVVAG